MTTAVLPPGSYRLTYADWLGFPDDGRLYEILGGELHVSPPSSIRHQRVSRELGFRVYEHLRRSGQGEVLNAPVGVRFSDEDVLEPDIVVVLTEHAERVGSQVIDGPADLVVESYTRLGLFQRHETLRSSVLDGLTIDLEPVFAG